LKTRASYWKFKNDFYLETITFTLVYENYSPEKDFFSESIRKLFFLSVGIFVEKSISSSLNCTFLIIYREKDIKDIIILKTWIGKILIIRL